MTKLIEKAENYVKQLLNEKLAPEFLYHSYHHTIRVVEKTKEILEGIKIKDNESEALLLAAWFHDAGYTQSPHDHEKYSADIATTFLTNENALLSLLLKLFN